MSLRNRFTVNDEKFAKMIQIFNEAKTFFSSRTKENLHEKYPKMNIYKNCKSVLQEGMPETLALRAAYTECENENAKYQRMLDEINDLQLKTAAIQTRKIAIFQKYHDERGDTHNLFCLFSHDKYDKMSAAKKIIQHLNGNTSIQFSIKELACLKEDHLGSLVKENMPTGWLEQQKPLPEKISINPGQWLNRR